MLKVKICGLNDPDNTKEIAGIAPDLMGFIFYPGSKRYVGNNPDNSLFYNIPPRIFKTGVFVSEKPSKIVHTMNLYQLDFVQLHGNESPGYCNSLMMEGLNIIKAFEISFNFNFIILEKYMDVCDYFLFDTKTGCQGGSGLKFDWKKLDEYHLDKPFFLGGGIGPEDASILKHINNKHLFAVDINSRFELCPGIKDSKKVKDFIDEIKG